MTIKFNYEEAFSRNIGWVTEHEQQTLRGKKIAIAGMGGVGGIHLLTLARLGIESFHIADLDEFELANFNRQIGATMNTINRPKVDVLREMALDINPQITFRNFPEGVTIKNIDAFLTGVDLYIDGLDFFVLDIRRKVFARCMELGIPAITAAPIGMGTGYLIFMPNGMTFDQYFRLQGLSSDEQQLNFLRGLVPKAFHHNYLVDPSRLDLKNQRGPSTAMGCQLCAGVIGTEALKILLKRGPIYAAPYYHQFDAYQRKWKCGCGWLPWGNRNPLEILKLYMGYRIFALRKKLAHKGL